MGVTGVVTSSGGALGIGLGLGAVGLVLLGVASLFLLSFSPFASHHYTDKPEDAPDYEA